MKANFILLFCFFCALQMKAQLLLEPYVETGIQISQTPTTYQDVQILGAYTELGLNRRHFFSFGLRYSANVTPLQIGFQSFYSLADVKSIEKDIELLGPSNLLEFQPKFPNSLSKYESFALHLHRKTDEKSGFLDLYLGLGHVRAHQFYSTQFPSLAFTGLPNSNSVVVIPGMNTIYEFKGKWSLLGQVGMGYAFGNFLFNYVYEPLRKSKSMNIGYRYNFESTDSWEPAPERYEYVRLSLAQSYFYGMSEEKNSGYSVIQLHGQLNNENIIGGFVWAMSEKHLGIDRRELPEFTAPKTFSNQSIDTNRVYCSSIFIGKIKHLNQKESWYWAGGLDFFDNEYGNPSNLGLHARLGWRARHWSGHLAYHYPFKKDRPPFLEYAFAYGFALKRERKDKEEDWW